MNIKKAKNQLKILDSSDLNLKKLTKAINFFEDFVNKTDIYIQESIKWGIDDFEIIARDEEEWENRINKVEGTILYDRTKFSKSLKRMINYHDASLGITWNTVLSYLNDYCLLKKK